MDGYLERWEAESFDGPRRLPCSKCNAEFGAYFPKYKDGDQLSYADWLRTKITEGCENGVHPNTIVELYSFL